MNHYRDDTVASSPFPPSPDFHYGLPLLLPACQSPRELFQRGGREGDKLNLKKCSRHFSFRAVANESRRLAVRDLGAAVCPSLYVIN